MAHSVFSAEELKMTDAVFRHQGSTQAVSRQEDCSHVAGHLQYLRIFPFTYKSKTKFNRSANNVKYKNKLSVKFKVLRV